VVAEPARPGAVQASYLGQMTSWTAERNGTFRAWAILSSWLAKIHLGWEPTVSVIFLWAEGQTASQLELPGDTGKQATHLMYCLRMASNQCPEVLKDISP